MKIEDLKRIGSAELKLTKLKAEEQKTILSPFSSDPEISKIIKYIEQYKTVLPNSHPIFKRLEELKKTDKDLAKKIVKDRMEYQQKNEQLKKEEYEKSLKIMREFNDMMLQLEKQNDKIFDFLNKNQRDLSILDNGTSYIIRAKRVLISIKNGIRLCKMK